MDNFLGFIYITHYQMMFLCCLTSLAHYGAMNVDGFTAIPWIKGLGAESQAERRWRGNRTFLGARQDSNLQYTWVCNVEVRNPEHEIFGAGRLSDLNVQPLGYFQRKTTLGLAVPTNPEKTFILKCVWITWPNSFQSHHWVNFLWRRFLNWTSFSLVIEWQKLY